MMKNYYLYITLIALNSVTVSAQIIQAPKIIATHYSGDTWLPDMWSNLTLKQVEGDLQRIKNEGFNSIIIGIPWVGFQPQIQPITYFEPYWRYLEHISATANTLGLGIMYRIGYAHATFPKSQPNGIDRGMYFFNNPQLKIAWLDFIAKIAVISHDKENFLFGFITWEDFYNLYVCLYHLKERQSLAKHTGFQTYLKNYDLTTLSLIYKQKFNTHQDIPIPLCQSEAFPLFNHYWEQSMQQRFEMTQNYFPKFSMEVRVDCEKSAHKKTYLCHQNTFNINHKTDITTIYYNPAWGAKNESDFSSADEAIGRFNYFMNWFKKHTDQAIFIDQFNFIDNTPIFHYNTKIYAHDINTFLQQITPILKEETIGYALWTMQDVPTNIIKNGSFQLNTLAWHGLNNEDIINKKGYHWAQLKAEQAIRSTIDDSFFYGSHNPKKGKHRFTFSLSSQAKETGQLEIRCENKNNLLCQKSIVFNKGLQHHKIQIDAFKKGHIQIKNKSKTNVLIDNVMLYSFIQDSGIYDLAGHKKPYYHALKKMNMALSQIENVPTRYRHKDLRITPWQGQSNDLWVSKTTQGKLRINNKHKRLIIALYTPENLVNYHNVIDITINNKHVKQVDISAGFQQIVVTLAPCKACGLLLNNIYNIRISAQHSININNDKRPLAFQLVDISTAP